MTALLAGAAVEQRTCPLCSSSRSWRRRASGGALVALHGPRGERLGRAWLDETEAAHELTREVGDQWWEATAPPGATLRERGRVVAEVTRGGLWRFLPPEG